MYFKLNSILFAVSILSILTYTYAAESHADHATKKIVSIYYETYCPDSIRFFVEQFYPAYATKDLHNYIVPQVIPYGNASTNNSTGTPTFICEHGPKECHGNLVHACVLISTATLSDKLKFVNCTLATVDTKETFYPTEHCAQNAGINLSEIKSCIDSGAGNKTLAEYGSATFNSKDVKALGIPFVLFDDVYDINKSKQAVSNFKSTVCGTITAINGTKPEICNNQNGASAITNTVLPIVVLTFLLAKMY